MESKENMNQRKNKISLWDESIIAVLAAIVIFIPIIFYPYCIPAFDPIKNTVLQLLALLGLGIFVLKNIYTEKFSFEKKPVDKIIFLYLLYGSISLIWSVNIYHSIIAWPLFLAGPILYFLSSNTVKKQPNLNFLVLIILYSGTIMGFYGILQYLGIDFDFWAGNVNRGQVFGLFGNVNYFAEYLILPLSLALGLFINKERVFSRLYLIISLIAMGGGLFFTFTRGSYLGIAAALTVMMVLYYQGSIEKTHKKYYQRMILFFLIMIFIALAVIYIPHTFNKAGTPLGRLRERVTIENITSGNNTIRRIAIWKITWLMIKDRPVLGSGIGTFDYHTLDYQAKFFAQGDNRDIYPHGFAAQSHNEYLQIWSELGLVGLLLFLGIIFVYYRHVLLNLKRINKMKEKAIVIGLAGGIAAVLVDALVNFPLQLPGSIVLFWLFIGLTNTQINMSCNTAQLTGKEDTNTRIIESKNINTHQKNTDSNLQKRFISNNIVKITLTVLVILIIIIASSFIIRPFMARVYWYYGNQQIVKGNFNEAISIYEKGLKWNPWQGEMHFDIASILMSKGINNVALENFEQAEKYVAHHNIPQNIAAIYLRWGEAERAIPFLEKSILYQKDKKSMLPYQLQLGNIYLAKKNFQKAKEYFGSAIDNNPDNAEAYYGIAGV
ncbi:MAG: O-antigen ligase family protein, partial [Atribacterota bacterium]|nr:O-antigen ligase family protein [Atribacterota bacterium]